MNAHAGCILFFGSFLNLLKSRHLVTDGEARYRCTQIQLIESRYRAKQIKRHHAQLISYCKVEFPARATL